MGQGLATVPLIAVLFLHRNLLLLLTWMLVEITLLSHLLLLLLLQRIRLPLGEVEIPLSWVLLLRKEELIEMHLMGVVRWPITVWLVRLWHLLGHPTAKRLLL